MIVDRFGAMILVVVKYMFNAFVTFIAFSEYRSRKRYEKKTNYDTLDKICIYDDSWTCMEE